MSRLFARVAAGMVLLAFPICSLAHITLQPSSAPSGSYFVATFVVPHGCDGSPTIALRMEIPDGITVVKPQMKPGWRVTIKNRRLARPLTSAHGQSLSQVIDEVDWHGGPLPDDLYDTFGLMLKLPDTPGRTLYFPVVQECRHGVRHWIDIPAPGRPWSALREPAPSLELTARSP
jgi:periplasmic copper chaperone A